MAIAIIAAGKNARLDVLLNSATQGAVAAQLGDSPKLKIYSGTPPGPANAIGATDKLLVNMTLPVSAFAAASGGAKAKAGTWSGTAGDTGTAGYFRLTTNLDAVILEGTVGQGSGDLSLDNTSIALNQTVTINTFSISDGN